MARCCGYGSAADRPAKQVEPMASHPRPTQLKSINEDGAIVRIVEDMREPYGSRKFSFNPTGFERHHGLIDEYSCNGLETLYHGIEAGRVVRYLAPDLGKIKQPRLIKALQIAEAGEFSPEFDFSVFHAFDHVRSFSIWNISMGDGLPELFPELEVLRVFDWNTNKIEYRPGLWPNLRCLHLSGFRGDLSRFEGWDIKTLFLDSSSVTPFSSLKAMPNLETLRADGLTSKIDLSVLAGFPKLKHVSLRKPRSAPATTGFASGGMEMMILEKIDHIDLQNFPNLKIYGIDLGKEDRLDRWDEFHDYGDPFATVHFRRYAFSE
jgi:hypothetical protein